MSKFTADNEYIILNASSRTVMDLQGGLPIAATPVIGHSINMANDSPHRNNQIWKVETSHDGEWYKVINQMSGTVLDLSGGRNVPGTAVIGQAANGGANQDWKFDYVTGTYPPLYTIRCRASAVNIAANQCLDLNCGNPKDGTKIELRDGSAGNRNQMWMLIKSESY